ncbi:hypothetical protein PNEG_03433 [Pneumocystis murina B123]|uniref:Uncharacterized protein n=1 Tax=Pneumocystis murina (strain B123) TaxID=1069680 RepID=M7NI94_PNEMU|nr:hypothetical protein PNEG_03433 [Pneumocystis murina B123]EMR08268.1 hypothetical protein PNEG_03433 [Pneumocystis murina B123]
MKIILFFLFTFITYVLSETFGPLGFAALMPPFKPSGIELRFFRNLASYIYNYDDILMFLTRGDTRSCLRHLSDACEELTRVYGDLSKIGDAVKSICEHQHEACQKLPKVKEDSCRDESEAYDYLANFFLNGNDCRTAYTKCRLRSRGCSSELSRKCRTLLSHCNYAYNEEHLRVLFANFLGDSTSESFRGKLKKLCNELSFLGDQFVQLCLNPDSLQTSLPEIRDSLRKSSLPFYSYPKMSIGALLDASELDGGLYSPKNNPTVDPSYFMGYLLGQHRSTSFASDCVKMSQKCLGLDFFPQSAYFCDAKTTASQNSVCEKTRADLFEQHIPNLKKELEYKLSDEQYPEVVSLSGIDVDFCKKFLGPCSYLENLDSKLYSLCDRLKGRCAYDLEIASSLSVYEYYFRKFYLKKDPNTHIDLCQEVLPRICGFTLNTTVDFLTFCLNPTHTCFALAALVNLRCDRIKQGMTQVDPSHKDCVTKLREAETYGSVCTENEEYVKFLTTCYETYFDEYIKELANSKLKKLTPENKFGKLNDGF